jgi:hypothetical protein
VTPSSIDRYASAAFITMFGNDERIARAALVHAIHERHRLADVAERRPEREPHPRRRHAALRQPRVVEREPRRGERQQRRVVDPPAAGPFART